MFDYISTVKNCVGKVKHACGQLNAIQVLIPTIFDY